MTRPMPVSCGGAAMPAAADGPAGTQAAPDIRHVVLVHGAWADGSSWAEVIIRLQARGLQATAVQNPLTSLADDVATTRRAIARQDGPTLLVGHSYGGAVVTEAGTDPRVSGLVYVAALAPDAGEGYEDLAPRFPPPAGAAHIRGEGGYATLDPDGFARHFAPDLPPERARVLAAVQGPIRDGLFAGRTIAAAWREKPCWYAVSAGDRIVVPELQRFLATRMRAVTVELATGHASPLSRPDEITALILQAAGRR